MINNEIKRFKVKLINTNSLKCEKYIGNKFDCLLGVFLFLENNLGFQIRTSMIKDIDESNYPLLKIKTLNSIYKLEVIEED